MRVLTLSYDWVGQSCCLSQSVTTPQSAMMMWLWGTCLHACCAQGELQEWGTHLD